MRENSRCWHEGTGKHGKPNVNVGFDSKDCGECEGLSRCTRKTTFRTRHLTFPRKEESSALQAARERQQTEAFRLQYQARAGVEGLISQATLTRGMRRARYRGRDNTHLQHVVTAGASNLFRSCR